MTAATGTAATWTIRAQSVRAGGGGVRACGEAATGPAGSSSSSRWRRPRSRSRRGLDDRRRPLVAAAGGHEQADLLAVRRAPVTLRHDLAAVHDEDPVR